MRRHGSRPWKRASFALVAVTSAVGAFPSHGLAATYEDFFNDQGSGFVARAGEVNHVTIRSVQGGMSIQDTVGVSETTHFGVKPICRRTASTTLVCPLATLHYDDQTGPGTLQVHLGDKNDVAVLSVTSGSRVVFAGPGNDGVYGSSRVDWINAGPGADAIHAGAGNDLIYSVDRAHTRDTIDCGLGIDTITADSNDRLISCERRVAAVRNGIAGNWP